MATLNPINDTLLNNAYIDATNLSKTDELNATMAADIKSITAKVTASLQDTKATGGKVARKSKVKSRSRSRSKTKSRSKSKSKSKR